MARCSALRLPILAIVDSAAQNADAPVRTTARRVRAQGPSSPTAAGAASFALAAKALPVRATLCGFRCERAHPIAPDTGVSVMHVGRAARILALWAGLASVCWAARPSAIMGSPTAREQLRVRGLLAPDGQYTGAQFQHALRARTQMLSSQSIKQQSGGAAPPLLHWVEIGPGNVGGRVNAIWVDPANTQHLIVGSASGGLWQSSDAGSTWTAVSEFPGALTIGAIAQLPSGTLLVGTGDAFTAAGDGMLSSTDGGATWAPISSTAPSTSDSFWLLINSIAVSSSGVALAATYGGIARSTDGQTWTRPWLGGNSNRSNSMDVVFDPHDSNDAVADNENGGVVYTADAGLTWSLGGGLPVKSGARVSLAFDPSVAHSVYALVDENDGTSPSGQVWHSANDGAAWTLLADTTAFVNTHSGTAVGALCDNAASGTPNCQGSYDNVILVEPHTSGTQPTILAGGIDIFASTDGGTTWTETGSWLTTDTDYIHADQHAFAFVPSSGSGTLYVGNDGGFYKQLTSSTWREQSEGLAVTQFYSVSGYEGTTSSLNVVNGAPVTPIVGGSQDNGTLLYEGYSVGGAPLPDDWTQIYGGDGGTAHVDPGNGNDIFGEYVHLTLGFSLQGGQNAQAYTTEPPDTANKAANFIAPFELLPASGAPASQMLAGGASLWLGTGIQAPSPLWRAINAGNMPSSTANSNDVSAIAIDPVNTSDVWVGYDDGEIWHSVNALDSPPTWSKVGTGVLPGREVDSLWIVPGQASPGPASTIYATFDGYPSPGAGSNVWVTTDGGGTWTDAGSALPGVPVYSLVTHPAYPQILYAGTLLGVLTSSDGGQTWNTSRQGPANVEVRQLSWFDTSSPDTPTLLAATFGRGAWLGSPAYNPTPALTSISPAAVTIGAPDTSITLTGSGFVEGMSTVTLDGSPIDSTFQSATELVVTAPLSTLAILGTHTFVVSNPIPGGGASTGANLTVGEPAPVLDSISPSSATAGSSEITLTVAGSGFALSSVVEWNGSALSTTYESATSLMAYLPATDLAAATQAQVEVVTPQPGGGTSSADTFAVNAAGGGGGGALGDTALLLLLGANLLTWSRRRGRGAAARV